MILDENLFQDYRKPLKESAEAVKRILQPRVTKYGIKPFGDKERLPRCFRFKSSNGTNGEVTYNGRDYVYAIKNGEVRVMDSSKASHNLSETIYKESINKSNPYLTKRQSIEVPICVVDRTSWPSTVYLTSDLLKDYEPAALTSLTCDKDEYFLVEVYKDEEDGTHIIQCPHCQTQYIYENDDLETAKELKGNLRW